MARTAIGIDIGGTQIKAALVDDTGAVLKNARVKTPLELNELRRALKDLLAGIADDGIAGVGVACKGIIDPATTRVECLPGNMGYVEGSVLSSLVCEALDAEVPVFADNDARVALVGECVWGAAKGRRDVLMFTLGTGIGGGILSGGRILRGHGGIAGHLGHVNADPDGAPCICGNHGCLETVFSARVIESDAYSALHRGLVTSFAGSLPSCEDVFAAAARGDETALWIVNRGARKMGAAVAGLLHALDPEIVIIGGQMAGAGATLFEPVRNEVAWRTRTLLRREVPIVPPQVADPTGVAGAAALVFQSEVAAMVS